MDKCRNDFELNQIVKDILEETPSIYFCDKKNRYIDDEACFFNVVNWINGAWFTWQEQQKVINTKHEAIESLSIAFKKMQDDCKDKQKQIDAVKVLIKSWLIEAESEQHKNNEDWVSNILNRCVDELEQALKGGEV